ncbi:MMPL family transporter [Streptomyces alboniger]|uniref:MMPL family transporter n=1 Tax=Streptomyces alboniger TaxID=132473 RepID=A0A5J6HQI5_STRAD|nr:MMPL family transporter [Streptomyces alboniger]QEV21778.1 MMPL family transporter [Streptomyces alboniger]
MLRTLGLFLFDRARTVLIWAGLLTLAAGAAGIGVFGQLKSGGFEDPTAPSSRAARLLDKEFGGTPDLVLLVRPRAGTVDSPAVRAAGDDFTDRLSRRQGVQDVVSYWRTPAAALRAEDGSGALVLVQLAGDGEEVAERAAALIADHADADDKADADADGREEGAPGRAFTVVAGGPSGLGHDISTQVAKDLGLAEGIAIPVTFALLVLVFRGLAPALVPLGIGVVAVLGTFAELHLLARVTDVSVFAINLTTALGLGLAIDYGLLMVSRYREQLAAGQDPREAVGQTVATAGRTIVFSAATVAAALAAPLVFPLAFLRSFAYAGLGVVATAALCALLVTPALLTVLGPRLTPRSVRAGGGDRLWERIARTVLRHPLRTALPAFAVLVVAAAPLLGVRFGTPDERVMPENTPSRTVAAALRAEFPHGGGVDSLDVVVTGGSAPSDVAAYARAVSEVTGVDSIDHDTRTSPGSDLHHITVRTSHPPASEEAAHLVKRVRAVALPGPGEALVGGPAARAVDTKQAIGDRLPLALAMIATSTFVLLFLFTGSVTQPLRALLLNALGMGAILGTMVWIFQTGHFSGLLGCTPMPMDTAMTLLMFCVVFGLSMDYEVFVLGRIKELHDQGLPTAEAVPRGLGRSGSIVSAAAALLAVSLLAFATSSVSFMQMFGLGSGLAVLLDALLIRGVLVPTCLRLLGRHNWYAPRPLRALHRRFGLAEAPAQAMPK